MKRILVTGAGGFIGTHLVRCLKKQGHFVRGVDLKLPSWSVTQADEFWLLDLRDLPNAQTAVSSVDQVYALAADMGGMGFISKYHAEIIRNNTLITVNTLEAARARGVKRLLYSSSACVYPMYKQDADDAAPLKESDVYPADPQGAYGWEKLHGEHLCKCFREAGWLDTRVVRFHNTYGPEGDWVGGREKVISALCRKIAEAKRVGDPRINIWGDGKQVRSFMYVDDCCEGLLRLMESDFPGPLHLGRDRAVAIDRLVDIIAGVAGVEVEKVHVKGPVGVRHRNANNALCREILRWEPSIPLETGIAHTYPWVEQQVMEAEAGVKDVPRW